MVLQPWPTRKFHEVIGNRAWNLGYSSAKSQLSLVLVKIPTVDAGTADEFICDIMETNNNGK